MERRLCRLWLILSVRVGICEFFLSSRRGRVSVNSLLDIGPTSEGEIIQPMRDGLIQTGEWLKYSGECVYDTVRSVSLVFLLIPSP